jgi:putative transposase
VPIRDRFSRFADLLATAPDAGMFDRLRAAEGIGRPLGGDGILGSVERVTGRRLRPRKRGPKRRTPGEATNADLFSALSP